MRFNLSDHLKQTFWRGMKTFVPIVLTFAIVIWILTSLETFFGRFLEYVISPKYYFPGLGILVGLAIIFAVGILVNAWVIKKIYHFTEELVKRIPFIKTIYNAIQDLFNFFDKNYQAQQTVLIKTPMGQMMGFITRKSLSQISTSIDQSKDVIVYVPLSYTIGGFMLIVPREDLEVLDWPVEKAMSFVLMAGMIKLEKKPSEKNEVR